MNVPLLRFADCYFRPGDLIFHSAYDLEGKPYGRLPELIAQYGRGWASHVGMITATEPEILVTEMWWPEGGREVPLHPRVIEHPGMVYWYKIWDVVDFASETWPGLGVYRYDRSAAVAKIRTFIGQDYGTCSLLQIWMLHHPRMSWLELPDDDEYRDYTPVCSAACAEAVQDGFGGFDPVPFLHAEFCEPMDLARCNLGRFMGRIVQ